MRVAITRKFCISTGFRWVRVSHSSYSSGDYILERVIDSVDPETNRVTSWSDEACPVCPKKIDYIESLGGVSSEQHEYSYEHKGIFGLSINHQIATVWYDKVPEDQDWGTLTKI